MKSILISLLAMVFSSQSGCSESTQSPMREVFVSFEIESAFRNDLVKLSLDGKTLLESRVTTNDVLSLAWSSGLQKLSNTNHLLYFEVVEYVAHDVYNIDLTNDTSTVTIRFDKSMKQIQFQQFKGRLFRD